MADRKPRSSRFLPPDPRVEEPYRVTPQLALRIGIVGTVALAVFAVLFLRLWALQVLSGSQYLNAAQNNQLRTVRLEAQRGEILDRTGRTLVSNVPGTAVRLWPADLQPEGRYRELQRLAKLLNVPLGRLVADVERRKSDPLTPVTVKTAVPEDKVAYLREHQDEFPGVAIETTYLRDYEFGSRAAHVLGHVGEITKEQLKTRLKAGYRGGDKIGQEGVEAAYDRYLRGRPGVAQLTVDALGKPKSSLVASQMPRAGNALRLTIDAPLQRAAEQALREWIEKARSESPVDCIGCWSANGGAIVALDPRNGAIRALASNPTYKPSVYVGRVDPRALAKAGLTKRTAPAKNIPSLNRAVAGEYPSGSTFKPVTALAAMQEGLIEPYDLLPCTPDYEVDEQTFANWTPNFNEGMTLPTALETSCDTYFYRVGKLFYDLPEERGQPLQEWASTFGFGRPTGLDIGGEESGLLPTIEWRRRTYTKKTDPCCWQVDRLWKSGDSVQLAIGQKDLQVTPLQMARFFAVVANGGKLVTPHVGMRVERIGARGTRPVVLRQLEFPRPRPTSVDPKAIQVVRDGLYAATHGPNGTSTAVFGNFPIPIAGKTGTAEKSLVLPGWSQATIVDQAWWCGYGPSDNPELVVCAVIENGGHGGSVAAPAALRVFEEYFGVKGYFELPSETD